MGSIVADSDLQFVGTPGHVIADATSPDGAIVTFDTPKVSDGTKSPPAAECGSATGLESGSGFPIGDTTVTCKASDLDDTPSTVTLAFVVTVNGPLAQLNTLLRVVTPLRHGQELREANIAAIHYLTNGDVERTDIMLQALTQETRIQSGWVLKPQLAAFILDSAARIQGVLFCRTTWHGAAPATSAPRTCVTPAPRNRSRRAG